MAQARWPVALAAAGFNPGTPAAFVAEGFTWYLPEQAVALLLDQAASIATPGSRLGVDMVSADYLTNPAIAPSLELAAARGARWQFGTNDPGGFLTLAERDVRPGRCRRTSLTQRQLPNVVSVKRRAREAVAMSAHVVAHHVEMAEWIGLFLGFGLVMGGISPSTIRRLQRLPRICWVGWLMEIASLAAMVATAAVKGSTALVALSAALLLVAGVATPLLFWAARGMVLGE